MLEPTNTLRNMLNMMTSISRGFMTSRLYNAIADVVSEPLSELRSGLCCQHLSVLRAQLVQSGLEVVEDDGICQ